jgi:peptidoglycan-N-acetylmuramic acid deacetylase
MNKTATTVAAVLLAHTLLIGCSDSPPAPTASEPSGTPIAAPVQQPQASQQPIPATGKPEVKEPAATTPPANGQEPAKPAPTVSQEVYQPGGKGQASAPTAQEKKQLSWYYMRQGKGKVPNFPADTKLFKPSHKAFWVGSGKKIYLTFDNGGPMGDMDKMLKVLKENDVKASYFIAGYNMKKHPDYIRQLVEDGHFVANHSMSHKDFTTMTDEQVRKEITDFEALFKEITGQEVGKVFRFPYGSYNLHLLDVVASMGYSSAFWSTAMKDWEPRANGWKDAYNDIMNNLHEGNIVLLHQASQENIDALDEVIKAIKKEGYEFGTVDEISP